MPRYRVLLALALIALLAVEGVLAPIAPAQGVAVALDVPTDPRSHQRIAREYGQVPVTFEQNVGQFDARARFVARGGGVTAFLTATGAAFAVKDAAVFMTLDGANPAPSISAEGRQPGVSHYLIGADPQRWHPNVPHFGVVRYAAVYPGIELVYYADQPDATASNRCCRLRYDFIVAPGADPDVIRLSFAGQREIEIDAGGDLLLHMGDPAQGGVLRQRAPFTYQEIGGQRVEVSSRFERRGDQIGFALGDYDARLPLIIDPDLVYATYLGGGNIDEGRGVAVDVAGHAYIVGSTSSTNFPTLNAVDATLGGGQDVFVTKLNVTGTALVYSTYLGGSGLDTGLAIAGDSGGGIYVTGTTSSTDFPILAPQDGTLGGGSDAFVTKINATGGSLVYSTYLGGSNDETAYGIAVDSSNRVYVTGTTDSTNFPTLNALDATLSSTGDIFVTKYNATGATFAYSTYLGGTGAIEVGNSIAADASGNAYLTGTTLSADFPTTTGAFDMTANGESDAFVTKLNAAGSALVYSTYLGGTLDDVAQGIAVDSSGNAYLIGQTSSANFPMAGSSLDTTLGGFLDAFVTKLNAAGSALSYSTYLGGSDSDFGYAIAVDGVSNMYASGQTASANFPTASPLDATLSGNSDAFVTRFNATGDTFVYSTFLGGSADEAGYGLAVDSGGNAYVVGQTYSANFPTAPSPGAVDTTLDGFADAFVAKIGTLAIPATPTQVSPAGVLLGTLKPTYTWNTVLAATQYNLVVVNSATAQQVVNTIYPTSACTANQCAVTPNVTLVNSQAYAWYVVAGNALGWSPFPAGMVFVPSVALTTAPTIISPVGAISSPTLNPTYTWSKVDGAVLYAVAVFDLSTSALKIFESFSAAGCGASTCSATPMGAGATLTNGGTYGWFVAAVNYAGVSPWSSGAAFILFAPPAVPTLIAPLGTTTGATPTYSWNRTPGATQYFLSVFKDGSVVYQNLLTASVVCGATTCQFTQPSALTAGAHAWFLSAINVAGSSANASGTFTVGASQPAPTFAP
jgi:hypothetical protein